MEIACSLVRIMISETEEQQVIVLKETKGTRAFPIMIGFFEAAAIDRRIKGIQLPRPLTHDLLATVIARLGGRLARVVVTDIRDHTFFANLIVEHDGTELLIDARPSDAIALAVANDTPIFVEDHVLEAVAGPRGSQKFDV